MTITYRRYNSASDYMRVRQFLIDTFALHGRPDNWLIDRWNFCRHVVIPHHSYYNVSYFGVSTRPVHHFRDELPLWERSIGVWENEQGDIVAVVHSENEEAGEVWTQIHPDYAFLYDDMVSHAEEHLADRVDGLGFIKLYVNEGCELERVAQARGYRRLDEPAPWLEYAIESPAQPELPEGFSFRTVAEEDDVDKRRRAKAIAFGGNYAPSDWVPAEAYAMVQQAPDYRKDLDLFIAAPDGEYVSFCTIWIDQSNKYGVFEPVGTHREYQGQGFGRALLQEGFRLMAQNGATRSFMQTGIEFYKRVGFKEMGLVTYPWIRYFDVS
jgi:ribosomal protein S18 acetylase RimI-like enzyme